MFVKTRQLRNGDSVSVVKWDDGNGYGILRTCVGSSPKLVREINEDDIEVRCLAHAKRMSPRRACEKTALALLSAI